MESVQRRAAQRIRDGAAPYEDRLRELGLCSLDKGRLRETWGRPVCIYCKKGAVRKMGTGSSAGSAATEQKETAPN